MTNLPSGITYTGPADSYTERDILTDLKARLLCESQDEFSASRRLGMPFENHQSLVSIGLFTIDIEQVAISGLKSMRKLLPRSEYIMLKKRKCARVTRARGKNEKRSLIQIIENLRDENAKLRSQLGRSPVQNYSYDYDQSVSNSDSGGASIRMEKVGHMEPSMMTAAMVEI